VKIDGGRDIVGTGIVSSLGIGDIAYDREAHDETILLRTLNGECDKLRRKNVEKVSESCSGSTYGTCGGDMVTTALTDANGESGPIGLQRRRRLRGVTWTLSVFIAHIFVRPCTTP